MKNEVTIQEFFTPPTGSPRPVPSALHPEYSNKFKALGPFSWHEYDMDVCTIYRQMDDLRSRYKLLNGAPFENYVGQIKENVGQVLTEMNLDKEFYLNHFYFVVQPDNNYYFSFLGLFIALSDPLKVVPILEHHLKKFLLLDVEKLGLQHFFDKVEYQVCNFLRTNRFPEDFYAKHDKIINWIYSKKTLHENQTHTEAKLDALLTALNRVTPVNIPSVVLRDTDNLRSDRKPQAVAIEGERLEILYEDIKEYFSEESHTTLKNLLNGTAEPNVKILFLGQANQLCDVFRIYFEDDHISGTKRSIATWICDHFMYYMDSTGSPRLFDQGAVENVLYGQDLPPKGPKRICLSALKEEQHKYYPRN